LRIDPLQNGLTALRLYKKGLPLWKIGNHFRPIPVKSFIETETDEILEDELGEDRKELLSISARRLIRCASLVVENTVKGQIPIRQEF
jgi:hypothetical protein